MKREDFWNLFWLSGMPEAWLMSRPERVDFNTSDMTAEALPHMGTGLPGEVKELYRNKVEREDADMPGPSLTEK